MNLYALAHQFGFEVIGRVDDVNFESFRLDYNNAVFDAAYTIKLSAT